jgi:WD40 repeat protein
LELKLAQTITVPSANAGSMLFNNDGTRLVTYGNEYSARIWDVATGKEFLELRGHDYPIRSIAFAADGRTLATAGNDWTARLWNIADEPSYALVIREHAGPVVSVDYSPDGKHLLTASHDGTSRVFEAATGKPLATLKSYAGQIDDKLEQELLGPVRSAQFSGEGRLAVTAAADVVPTVLGKDGPLQFAPVRIWDWKGGKETLLPAGHESGALLARISPDNRYLLTATDGNARSTTKVGTSSIFSFEYKTTNSTQGSMIRVFDAQTGKKLVEYGGPCRLLAADFADDSQLVATVCSHGTLHLWRAADGHDLANLKERDVQLARFVPGTRNLLTCSSGGQIRIWSPDLKELLVSFDGHKHNVVDLDFSRDGRLLTASLDMTARIWDLATGEQLVELRGHQHQVLAARFNREGTKVVTASVDDTARIWDAATGQEQFALRGHADTVTSARFSPDGQQVATSSVDGTVRLWPVDPLPIARVRKPRDPTPDEREQFELP